jgi:hypothetical protein
MIQHARPRHLLIAACALAAGLSTPLAAHHSYGATYDVSREVKLEGTLVQFVLRNPHSFVHIQAPDEKGTMQRWAVEWAGTAQLNNQGIQRESLRVGDQIVILARPSRVPGEYRALMVTLRRPLDGFSWGSRAGEVVD